MIVSSKLNIYFERTTYELKIDNNVISNGIAFWYITPHNPSKFNVS
jgi:hypothetical protein